MALSTPPAKGGQTPEGADAAEAVLQSAANRVVRDALPGLATGLAVLQSILAVAHAVGSPAEKPLVVVDGASVVFAVGLRLALGWRTLSERWAHPVAAGYAAVAMLVVLIHVRLLADPLAGLMLTIVVIGAGSIVLSFAWLVSLVAAAFAGWLAVIASLGAPPGSRRVGIALVGSAAVAAMVLVARRRTFQRLEDLRARDEARRQELEDAHRKLEVAFASLRESEDTHRLLFDLGPLPAWVFDRETLRFLAVNDAAVAHYGYSRAEFLEMTVKDVRPPEDTSAFLDALANHPAERAEKGTYRHLTKGGALIHVEVVAHDFTLGEGKAVLSILTDVTERKRAEEALRRSRESFQLLFDDAPIGMGMVGSSLRYERANRALCETFGYSKEEIREVALDRLVGPEDREQHVSAIQEFIEGRRSSFHAEARYLRKGGEPFWGRVTVDRIEDSTGRMLFVLVILDDVSERRRAAEERERMISELQEALATVKTLRGLIPICAWCKKVRDDQGYWSQVEVYVRDRSEAEFSHGICPDCKEKLSKGG